ncbi:helix-turn-helix transcriptional regulator [Cerasicoccus arenae]|nr:helix-turn-helix transcriptional regulator [Cerasicoccus arenae]
MKAFELGEQIGVSATSVSKIVNGVTRPRQATFSRMCKVLCETKAEERELVTAFAGAEVLQEDDSPQSPDDIKALLEADERYLEVKAQSIGFRRAIARELDKAGIAYQEEYCEGIYVTDFLVEHQGRRIALECKFNTQRNFDKTLRIAGVLRKQLNCDHALVVVPYVDDAVSECEVQKVEIATPNELHILLT